MNNNNFRATKKVVVDAGHGGSDPGSINGNVYEKDFNLEVANYIYNRLKELGVPVYITRDTDETLDRNERVSRILNAFGNNSDVIVLSNHINAGGEAVMLLIKKIIIIFYEKTGYFAGCAL